MLQPEQSLLLTAIFVVQHRKTSRTLQIKRKHQLKFLQHYVPEKEMNYVESMIKYNEICSNTRTSGLPRG